MNGDPARDFVLELERRSIARAHDLADEMAFKLQLRRTDDEMTILRIKLQSAMWDFAVEVLKASSSCPKPGGHSATPDEAGGDQGRARPRNNSEPSPATPWQRAKDPVHCGHFTREEAT